MKTTRYTLMALMLVGCRAEGGSTLSILDVLAPSATCTFESSSTTYMSYINYDPHGYTLSPDARYLPRNIALTAKLQNRAAVPGNDANLQFPNSTPIPVRPDANDVVIVGFDTCWDLASRYAGASDTIDCESLPPDQRSFVPSEGVVVAGGEGLALARFLTIANLQAVNIFGPAFDPVAIPEIAPTAVTTGADPATFSRPLASWSTDAARDGAWGNFPASPQNTATLIVGLRAKGHTMVGATLESNWFYFPVDVVPGYLAMACGGGAYPVTCNGGATTKYNGGFVDLTASCMPGFGGGKIGCTTVATCP